MTRHIPQPTGDEGVRKATDALVVSSLVLIRVRSSTFIGVQINAAMQVTNVSVI
jgi:hypothetical protein